MIITNCLEINRILFVLGLIYIIHYKMCISHKIAYHIEYTFILWKSQCFLITHTLLKYPFVLFWLQFMIRRKKRICHQQQKRRRKNWANPPQKPSRTEEKLSARCLSYVIVKWDINSNSGSFQKISSLLHLHAFKCNRRLCD